MDWTIQSNHRTLQGEIEIPGDKSISHRAIMFGATAKGKTTIENFLVGEDCLQTVSIYRALGVEIEVDGTDVTIQSNGIESWQSPTEPLYAGNSGTTARLSFGLFAASPTDITMTGDSYLNQRPMDRIVHPLRQMNARIERKERAYLPLRIVGTNLQATTYEPPVASAQVKSAVLLAGTQTNGRTTVIEKEKTRDHTERLLRAFGVEVEQNGYSISVTGPVRFQPTHVVVPGDISSAAFFLAGAAIVEGSDVTLKRVGLNETRTGIIDVLRQMNAHIEISNVRGEEGEPYGDIRIRHSPLRAITIEDPSLIPRLIDELPLVALLATQAEGTTIIRHAEELRVKETDRIEAVTEVLTTMGAKVTPLEDGFKIVGKTPLQNATVDTYGDHRIGMMAAIAALLTEEVTITDVSCINISYPTFQKDLETLLR